MAPALATAPTPQCDVDRMLQRLLHVRDRDGELATQVQRWQLRSPAALHELAAVASGIAISIAATPFPFRQLRDHLFEGFVHNLLLESLVSRLAMLEKRHPHTHALTLDRSFNYHM